MQKLQGKTALITGGNSGIGLATAKLFLESGARVAITGRDQQALDEATKALGHDVLALRSDAASVTEIEALMSQINRAWGRLDVLFVNAAIAGPLPFEMVTESHFDTVMSVNLKGAFFAVQKALPLLAPGASVILTTSIANQIGAPNFSVYAASKAALRSLTQTLALELVGKGVRVNAVSPGPIATPIWGKFGLPADVALAAQQEVANKSPSKRFGQPEEVAKAALFLACEDSSYMVGQEVVVDGGMSLL
ncbi:SDR family oxidoreductase [Piscinibacter terrae]|uniref:SDR family oxidoreductase n=1 Tax=Piscinibacter terrae TaxID=2496871 RepID=A0A3N7JX96_9BURK|nr:SDR family oxidoreductase [Albitalea terrae]RQP25449.1 SDR family oxidoreductase [Albitalea terrae]